MVSQYFEIEVVLLNWRRLLTCRLTLTLALELCREVRGSAHRLAATLVRRHHAVGLLRWLRSPMSILFLPRQYSLRHWTATVAHVKRVRTHHSISSLIYARLECCPLSLQLLLEPSRQGVLLRREFLALSGEADLRLVLDGQQRRRRLGVREHLPVALLRVLHAAQRQALLGSHDALKIIIQVLKAVVVAFSFLPLIGSSLVR